MEEVEEVEEVVDHSEETVQASRIQTKSIEKHVDKQYKSLVQGPKPHRRIDHDIEPYDARTRRAEAAHHFAG